MNKSLSGFKYLFFPLRIYILFMLVFFFHSTIFAAELPVKRPYDKVARVKLASIYLNSLWSLNSNKREGIVTSKRCRRPKRCSYAKNDVLAH